MGIIVLGCLVASCSPTNAEVASSPTANPDEPHETVPVVSPEAQNLPAPTSEPSFYTGTPLIPAPASEPEDSPFLYAYDYNTDDIVIFRTGDPQPLRIAAPRPYESVFHLSPSTDKLAYISGSLTLDEGLVLTVLDLASGDIILQLPILAPGWEASLARGEEPGDDPVPAIVDPRGMAWSRDGSQLAFTAAIDRFHPDLYTLDLATLDVRRAAEIELAPNALAWSPDGERIAFLQVQSFGTGAGKTLDGIWVVDLTTGDPQRIPAQEGIVAELEEWLTSDSILVSGWDLATGARDLAVLNVSSGEIRTLLEGPLFERHEILDGDAFMILTFPEASGEASDFLHLAVVSTQSGLTCSTELDAERVFSTSWSATLNVMLVSGDEAISVYTPACELAGAFHHGGEAIVSPDGQWMLLINREDLESVIFQLASGQSYPIPFPGIRQGVWDADSSRVVIQTADRDLYAVSVENHTEEGDSPTPQLIVSDVAIILP